MIHPATLLPEKRLTLDGMYALIGDDIRQVNALILERVKNEIPLINDIVNHIINSGGKRIRPALTLICSALCGYNGNRHIGLAAIVEFIHTATLLHDDVVDESKMRRGLPTANEVFGNKASVLVGDFLLGQAFQLMASDGSLQVLQILSDASAIIAKGEVMQLMTEGEPKTTIQNYMEVITAKTAVLFASACELGAVVTEQPQYQEILYRFGMDIGIAFQLIDDALDYVSDEAVLGKSIGDDFREGKVTLPVILAYSAGDDSEKQFWNRTLGERDQKDGDLHQAVALLGKHDTISYCFSTAKTYCENARKALSKFPASPAREALFELVDFCENRAY